MLLALQLSDLDTAWYSTVLCDVTGATTGCSPVSAGTIYMTITVYNSYLTYTEVLKMNFLKILLGLLDPKDEATTILQSISKYSQGYTA